jgi:hypothetical protein
VANRAFNDYRDSTAALVPPTVDLIYARVLAGPASTADKVKVQAVHDTSGLYLGEASWPKPAGKELPAADDKCLVAIDNRNMPWIVAWDIPNWGH